MSLLLALLLTGCASRPPEVDSGPTDEVTIIPECVPSPSPRPKQTIELAAPWTATELNALALTLAGECYDNEIEDKRLVCEVVLNRASDGGFGGSSILDVLTAENQFEGYWTQSRPVSQNDYKVAEQALRDWYSNDCKALSEYLFFCAGDNHKNEFRSEF